MSFQIGASPNTTTSHLPWTSTKSMRMRDEVHADSIHMDRRQMCTTTYWWHERKGPFGGPNRRWEENNKAQSLYGSNIFPHDHPYFQHNFSIGLIVSACTNIRTASTTNFPTYVWECALRLSGGSPWTQKCVQHEHRVQDVGRGGGLKKFQLKNTFYARPQNCGKRLLASK